MKVSEIKHNHSLTELLKVLIFSILMLLPFLSIGTRCLYVICNKNAYQSYSGTETHTKVYTDLYVNNEEYYFYSEGTTINPTPKIKVEWIQLTTNNSGAQDYFNQHQNDIKYFDLTVSGTVFRLNFYDTNSTLLDYNTIRENNNLYLNFVALENGSFNNSNLFYQLRTDNYNNLDTVFDYSVDQMTNSPTFNWTQNTALYTGVKGMTDNLQVQTNLIAVLIVYWTILTIIYIILDIVLKMFEWLTHGLVKKS